MKNNLLDKFFKDTLSQLDGGAPANTWDALRDKMDTQTPIAPIEDFAFDQKIKDAIGSISVIEMPSWQAFVPSLDLEENLVEIEADITLDDTVKNSLESLDAKYDPSSWDALANRLDSVDSSILESQDEQIDQVSYEKLLNYTVPQKAGDWEAFDKELDKEFVLPYKLLFKYKLAEMAILASLILIFFQAQPHIQNHFENKKLEKTAELTQKVDLSKSTKNVERKVSTSKTKETSVKSAALVNGNTSTMQAIAKPKTSSNHTGIANSNLEKADPKNNPSQGFRNSASTQIPINIPKDSGISPNSSNSSNTTITAIVQSKNEQVPTEATPPQFVKQDENLSDFLLGVNRLPIESIMNIPFVGDDVTACFACDTDNTILRWRLGAHLDGIYTYIMTPYDNILNLNSYNHTTLGYGAGLSTSLVLDKWELESGFNFISRQYTPRAVQTVGNIVQGFLDVEISKIQMNVLSVPLNLRYHFNDKRGKTHFYMHGGATMHVATQVNHFRNSNFVDSNKRPGLNDSRILFEESDIISDKIFSGGWFEGGSYIENRYLTVNLGLGFERKISSRYSIFGQTTYAQYLDNKGLGANNDRFNSVEFSTGVRALFK